MGRYLCERHGRQPIKDDAASSLAGNENVVFDWTGNVYDSATGDLLGSLTEGGAKAVKGSQQWAQIGSTSS